LHLEDGSAEPRPPIDVPLCYGGDYGPDLPEVAHLAHMAMEEVVAAHSAVTYRVFMLGFVPGFPYMGLVDPRIAVPRRAIPRIRVPRGSVGIAGRQTGIYPVETPGGWQLIGRTPIGLFDARRQPPSFFRPGDSVRFYPVDEMEFHRSWSPPLGGLSSR